MSAPQPLADRPLDQPDSSRLSPHDPNYDVIIQAHRRALEAGAPGYLDPVSLLYVLTAKYHADRGCCCENNCRHCPYFSNTTTGA